MFIIMNAHLDTAPAAPGTIPRWCEQILHNPLYTLESANSITKFQLLMDTFRGQHSGIMSNRLHVWQKVQPWMESRSRCSGVSVKVIYVHLQLNSTCIPHLMCYCSQLTMATSFCILWGVLLATTFWQMNSVRVGSSSPMYSMIFLVTHGLMRLSMRF